MWVGVGDNNIKNNQKGKETNVAGGKRPLIERSDPSGENVFSVEKPAEDAEPLEAEKFQVAIAELSKKMIMLTAKTINDSVTKMMTVMMFKHRKVPTQIHEYLRAK